MQYLSSTDLDAIMYPYITKAVDKAISGQERVANIHTENNLTHV